MHLTNFTWEKKAWQVYMTIVNILSRTWNSPAKILILLLILCPVPPKFTNASAWIADYAKYAALQGISSKSCPKCEVPCADISRDSLRMYPTPDYMLYRVKALRPQRAKVVYISEYLLQLRVKIGNNGFTGLDWVSQWTYPSQTSCTTSTVAHANIWSNGCKHSWKRPIAKSHNGRESR